MKASGNLLNRNGRYTSNNIFLLIYFDMQKFDTILK